MVNKFLDAITIALYNKFGDLYTFYIEEVEQNFDKPCCIVGTLNPLIRSVSSTRYYRTIPIVIHFFTEKENTIDAKKDNHNKAEGLIEALEYLKLDNLLFRGENMEYEIVDGVLQFFITYNFYTTTEIEQIYMEEGTYKGVPM